MKPGSINGGRVLIALCIMGVTLSLVSWDRKQTDRGFQQQHTQDTIPQKKDKKIRDLDDAIAELESVDLKIELDNAMKEVDKALKELDLQKIELDVQRSLKEVDFEKIKMDVDKAMKEVDFAKIEKEVKESIARIDWDKMKAEMDKVKIDFTEMEAGLEKSREEMKRLGPQIEKELRKAREEIEKAKTEMKEYKTFVDGLEKDGLIDKKKGYTIEHKDGKLLINEKEASAQTYEKYRSFLEKHKKFNIEKDDNDFDIDMD
jgi:hypothetical protein